MQINIFSREYPPYVYGGAGVHVTQLVKELRKLENVNVFSFAEGGETTRAQDKKNGLFTYNPNAFLKEKNSTFSTLDIDLQMAADMADADILHSHTWYVNFAGFIGKKYSGSKHIISAHSLEPLRPWKAEQLAGGYEISKWVERTAYEDADKIIAVSKAMKNDILSCYKDIDESKIEVVYNGVNLSDFTIYKNKQDAFNGSDKLKDFPINPNLPTAIFVGRITRQKGLIYLLQALRKLENKIQVILCAAAPDTKEIEQEFNDEINLLKKYNKNIVWIKDKLCPDDLSRALSMSDVFLCPSIYEPLGIVNLEAMAVKLPVVATATGGIVEVVKDKETGFLIEIDQVKDGTGTPINPDKFTDDIAEKIDLIFSDLDMAKKMGLAGYKRAKEKFSWPEIARQTVEVYKSVL